MDEKSILWAHSLKLHTKRLCVALGHKAPLWDAVLPREGSLSVGVPVVHVVLLILGVACGGGYIPGLAICAACAGLAAAVLPSLDVLNLCRREKPYVALCSREVVLTVLAFYVDSVAVYMVAVLNEHRDENITLQDNLRLAVVALCRLCPAFDTVLFQLPALYAEEAIAYTLSLAWLASRAWGPPFLAILARVARALRWCRLLRVACFCSTVMPSQTQDCFFNRFDGTYSAAEHWREALSHWRTGGGCNDLVFSGHLILLCLCALVYSTHMRDADSVGYHWLPGLVWCRVVHAGLRIIYAHSHMSVDVLVSATITCLVWQALPPPRPHVHDVDEDCSRACEEAGCAQSEAARQAAEDREIRRWLATLLITALCGFGLLLGDSSQAGPLSAYNQQRLHEVSVVASSGPADPKRPRLFCAMLHIEQASGVRWGYAQAVADTWGAHCDGMVLWDELREDITPLDQQAAQHEPETDAPPTDRWMRARRMWRYIGLYELDKFDWFVAVDDGGFVIPENLRTVLVSLNNQRRQEPQYVVNSGVWAPWGSVLNRAAVGELLKAFDGAGTDGQGADGACPLPSRTLSATMAAEYSNIASCLRTRGLRPLAWDEQKDVRDALGCGQGDSSVLDLKAKEPARPCSHAVLAYMVPKPGWVQEIFSEVYKKEAEQS